MIASHATDLRKARQETPQNTMRRPLDEKIFEATGFLHAANAGLVEALHRRYLAGESLPGDWHALFTALTPDAPPRPAPANGLARAPAAGARTGPDSSAADSVRAIMMIRAFRVRGHFAADLDPLKLEAAKAHPELDPAHYGFGPQDRDRPIFIDHMLGLESASVNEILAMLRRTYCGTLGVEFMHIADPKEKAWLQERIEVPDQARRPAGAAPPDGLSAAQARQLLWTLIEVEGFEKFLAVKYTGTKRFGLDGAESVIPALQAIIKASAELGVEEVVLGMPHRGRLNVLTHIVGKPYRAIFNEFQGGSASEEEVEGSGDVKYHLGATANREFGGRRVHLSLVANPSHLESVNPVVLGKARAKQDQKGDAARTAVLPVLLHGDAAFAGQGVVAECFGLSALRGHRSGGAIHLIVNNQIGFTTAPGWARSSPYPSDVAKMVQAPIFHVNGDDPSAVWRAARLAATFRAAFAKPVVIDLICYRRFGHNEADEPMFTQPRMYKKIKSHPSVVETYGEKLRQRSIVSREEIQARKDQFRARLDSAFQNAASWRPARADWLDGRWSGLERASGTVRRGQTGVRAARLRKLGLAACAVPEGFKIHPTVGRLLQRRREQITAGEGIDWATAEMLAFASLLDEGYPVRLVGQDSERGTFSQRHSVLFDQDSEEACTPLNHLSPAQARYEVVNSMLSEEAVLGFEYGYSLAEPNALVLWEAQFGDFANNAQTIIDQFISSGERKWLRMSGLVMLLPHGYEGQGPEHSSARLERFLQLCAEDNLQVANCTTPANYFHILRRQLHRNFRKPLIVMTPKSLLRHKACRSSLDALRSASSFHRVVPDPGLAQARPREIRRLVLCSGKVYYDLAARRDRDRLAHVGLIRLEQFYPFPFKALAAELRRFPHARLIWCQEEPRNMGAWDFVNPRIEETLKLAGRPAARAVYAGRPASAATATGFAAKHLRETEDLITRALVGKKSRKTFASSAGDDAAA